MSSRIRAQKCLSQVNTSLFGKKAPMSAKGVEPNFTGQKKSLNQTVDGPALTRKFQAPLNSFLTLMECELKFNVLAAAPI